MGTTPDGVGEGSSLDWFEIEPFEKRRPSTYKSKSGNVTCMSLDLGQMKQSLRNTQGEYPMTKRSYVQVELIV